jgi:hypothetical protein
MIQRIRLRGKNSRICSEVVNFSSNLQIVAAQLNLKHTTKTQNKYLQNPRITLQKSHNIIHELKNNNKPMKHADQNP